MADLAYVLLIFGGFAVCALVLRALYGGGPSTKSGVSKGAPS
ncbi:hypothetical protein [Antrihabitans cavernicola]|nr:hypothetical protein [Spelaeibacter cavernicola]